MVVSLDYAAAGVDGDARKGIFFVLKLDLETMESNPIIIAVPWEHLPFLDCSHSLSGYRCICLAKKILTVRFCPLFNWHCFQILIPATVVCQILM